MGGICSLVHLCGALECSHVREFIRNLIAVCVGLTILVALMTAGFFVGLAALAAGIIFWIYIKLRVKGIINNPDSSTVHHEETRVIEAEYEVVEEKKEYEREDKV